MVHQVHAGKLAADVAADVMSTALMWQRRVPAALTAGFVPPAIASVVVLRGDLSGLRETRRGRYVLEHMPLRAQAVRLTGQLLAWRAAYRRTAAGIVLGHLVVGVGWSTGLWGHFRRRSGDGHMHHPAGR